MSKIKTVIAQLEILEDSIKESSGQLKELERTIGLAYHIQSRAAYIHNCFLLPTEQREPDADTHRPSDEWFLAQLNNLTLETSNLVSFIQSVFPDFDLQSLYDSNVVSWDVIDITDESPPDFVKKGLDPYI